MGTNQIFGGRIHEDIMQEEKDINGSILKVNVFLAIVATLLSLIGMFNLVSLDIIRRTKEIGIRKIEGASVPHIIFLISKKFLIILLIATIAWTGRRLLSFSSADGQHMGLFCKNWSRNTAFSSFDNDNSHSPYPECQDYKGSHEESGGFVTV